jgi:hypothetical protein
MRATWRCAVRGERGTPSPNRHGTSSRFGRSARDAPPSGGRAPRERLVATRVPARGSAPANAPRGDSRPASGRVTTTRVSCPCVVVLQKSSGRCLAQRSAPSASSGSKARGLRRMRVDGSLVLVKSERASAPAHLDEGTSGASEAERSSSRERSATGGGSVACVCASARARAHAAPGDGRCPRSAKRAHLSRGSAWKRPRRPSEQADDR